MIEKHLGDSIDIHGGGIDLRFPHHENEIAQVRQHSHARENRAGERRSVLNRHILLAHCTRAA